MVAPIMAAMAGAGAASGGGFLSSIGGAAGIGSLLSGASSFLGGLGIGGSKEPKPIGQKHLRQFARQAITDHWDSTMASAKKHGIHPLAALGVNPASGPMIPQQSGSRGIDLAQMGQGIDRAANAGRSAVQRKLDALALEQAQLSNDYLRVQIAGAQKAISNTASSVPLSAGDRAYLVDGQSNSGLEPVASRSVAGLKSDKGLEAAETPAFKRINLGGGRSMVIPSPELSGAIEDAGMPSSVLMSGDLAVRGLIPRWAQDVKKWNKEKHWTKRKFPSPVSIYKYLKN